MDELPPPPWPSKLNREQRRLARERDKAFTAALKAEGRAAKWRYAGSEIFRQDGEWFASVLPSLTWECGVIIRFMLKPMALDSLFWEIVGLSENNRLPLSFRANGAWVLQPPPEETVLGIHVSDPEELARLVVREASRQLTASASERSVGRMLARLDQHERATGRWRALQICLLILADRLDDALELSRTRGDLLTFEEVGGFMTAHPDGSISSFLEQAYRWIVTRKRSSIRLT